MARLPLRQLAIRLACIHADDRAWILAQLDSAERQHIDELLQEIAELGLDKDPAVLAALRAEPMTRFAAESVMPDDVVLHAQVARAGHPYWGALLLQMYGSVQRRKVMDAMTNGALIRRWDHALADQTIPPALVAALARHVATERVVMEEASDVRA